MTVQEMLNIPFFSDMIVAGGQDGLFREVTSVSVMDAPDIHEWMKGGEFLITTAYIFKDSPEGMLRLISYDQMGIYRFLVSVCDQPAAGSASSVWSERLVSVNWQYSPIKDN